MKEVFTEVIKRAMPFIVMLVLMLALYMVWA